MSREIRIKQFLEKTKIKWSSKFDYPNINDEYEDSNSQITVVCPEHGSFKVSAKQHLAGRNKHGCKLCGDEFSKVHAKKSVKQYLDEVNEFHNNKFEYPNIESEYKNNKCKITVVCPIHGVFQQFANAHLKYGCRQCAVSNSTKTNEQFIREAKAVHGDKYDYSKVNYVRTLDQVEIVCPEHGSFWQKPVDHLSSRGCPICKIEDGRLSFEEFIERAEKIHHKAYEYLRFHRSDRLRIVYNCPEHGEQIQRVDGHLGGYGCLECIGSSGEKIITTFLKKLNVKFEREWSFNGCVNFETGKLLPFDFYLFDYNICIEFDGKHHFEPVEFLGGEKGFENVQYRDQLKDEFCKQNNIRLIRIPYNKIDEIDIIIMKTLLNN